MTVAAQTYSVTFTAVNEGTTLVGPRLLVGLTFQGTGLTANHRLVVTDSATPGAGSILADYIVEAAADNADLWGGRTPQWVSALSIANNTVGGTWVLTAFILDKLPGPQRVVGA